jgi:hypothetical protein
MDGSQYDEKRKLRGKKRNDFPQKMIFSLSDL